MRTLRQEQGKKEILANSKEARQEGKLMPIEWARERKALTISVIVTGKYSTGKITLKGRARGQLPLVCSFIKRLMAIR